MLWYLMMIISLLVKKGVVLQWFFVSNTHTKNNPRDLFRFDLFGFLSETGSQKAQIWLGYFCSS